MQLTKKLVSNWMKVTNGADIQTSNKKAPVFHGYYFKLLVSTNQFETTGE